MTPTATRSAPIAAASVSWLPRPFWIVSATPSGESSSSRSPRRPSARHPAAGPASGRRARARTGPRGRSPRAGRSPPCRGSRRASTGLLREAPLERDQLALLHREAVLIVGERPRADVAVVLAQRLDDGGADVGVALGELRLELAEEPEHVVEDEHLAVAIDARADADGRDPETLGRERRDGRGNGLQHDRE